MIKNTDLYVAAAVLGVGLLMNHATQAMDLPDGAYAGFAAGAQTWPCTSNECELEASSGFRPQGGAYIGYRAYENGWLTINGEAALSARMMESHGRNWPDQGIKNSYNNYGLATSATLRVVPEVEVFDGLHLGPLAGIGGGAFFLDGENAVAPVWEVGAAARYEINDQWSLTGRYSYMDTVGGRLVGRDLSYNSHGFLIGLQVEF